MRLIDLIDYIEERGGNLRTNVWFADINYGGPYDELDSFNLKYTHAGNRLLVDAPFQEELD